MVFGRALLVFYVKMRRKEKEGKGVVKIRVQVPRRKEKLSNVKNPQLFQI